MRDYSKFNEGMKRTRVLLQRFLLTSLTSVNKSVVSRTPTECTCLSAKAPQPLSVVLLLSIAKLEVNPRFDHRLAAKANTLTLLRQSITSSGLLLKYLFNLKKSKITQD
jgi:hypothetical protein